MDPNSLVVAPLSVIKQMIQETVTEEIKKVAYYSQRKLNEQNMTLKQAAEYCNVCDRTLVSRVRQGKLTNGGTGRKYMFKKSDLNKFIFGEDHDG